MSRTDSNSHQAFPSGPEIKTGVNQCNNMLCRRSSTPRKPWYFNMDVRVYFLVYISNGISLDSNRGFFHELNNTQVNGRVKNIVCFQHNVLEMLPGAGYVLMLKGFRIVSETSEVVIMLETSIMHDFKAERRW